MGPIARQACLSLLHRYSLTIGQLDPVEPTHPSELAGDVDPEPHNLAARFAGEPDTYRLYLRLRDFVRIVSRAPLAGEPDAGCLRRHDELLTAAARDARRCPLAREILRAFAHLRTRWAEAGHEVATLGQACDAWRKRRRG